jgi:hypothetical protein
MSTSELRIGAEVGGGIHQNDYDAPRQSNYECKENDGIQLNSITYSMSSDTHDENQLLTPTDPYRLYCFSPVQTKPNGSSTLENPNTNGSIAYPRDDDEAQRKRERTSSLAASLSPNLLYRQTAKRSKPEPSPRIDASGRNLLSPRAESYPPRIDPPVTTNYHVNDITAGMLGSGPIGSYNPPPYHSSHHHHPHHIMSSSSFPPARYSGHTHHPTSMASHHMSLKFLSNHSSAWNDRFKELLSYKKEHGDCLVPQRFPQNPQLGVWVNKQRAEYKLLKEGKKSSMTQERISALESVGFVWAKRRKGQPTWDLKFEELKRYRAENGDCLVPTKYAENPALGRWVSTQRAQYKLMQEGKPTTMTQERVHLLEHLGFVWRLQF